MEFTYGVRLTLYFIKFLFFSLLVFNPKAVYSQTLDISMIDNYGKNISPVIVTVSELSDSLTIKEFFELENGKGKIKLTRTYENIVINFKSYGYFKNSKIIEKNVPDSIYSIQVVLKEKPPVLLDDIIVLAKKKPFRIAKDTISYNVSVYSDGSERKIQEVIKKLPGILVNEQSGEIKYKGKSIETVTLDGDNLFGFNYTLGTKNINVDMVEQVEAIDNYAENPLLKGIEQGGKVSLNLKLKKGKIDVSGNIDFGSGWFEGGDQAFNLNSNLLGITKTYKSFATLAYNNVGVNHTPFDYFGFNYSLETLLGGDKNTAAPFQDGEFSCIYLAPKDYHRIHMPMTGTLREMIYVPGDLFSVNPLTANNVPNLFARNERVVAIFDTTQGAMAMVLVGATIVASIETVWAGTVTPPAGKDVFRWQYPATGASAITLEKGAEMGRFKLGSTVVTTFAPDMVKFNQQAGPETVTPIEVLAVSFLKTHF